MKRLRVTWFHRLSFCAALLSLAGPSAVHAENAPAPARAAPTAVEVGKSSERLSALQDSVGELERWVKAAKGSVSAVVLDPSGSVLAEAAPDLLVNPASNMKVLTAAAALRRLGPDYRYTTGVYGRLKGETLDYLVLRGHGDPSLDVGSLYRLAHALVGMGLKRVTGDILVDQTRFDEQFVPPAFEQQPNEWAYFRAPVSAIALERNTVTLNVMPQAAGSPARTWFEPGGFVRATGQVTTGAPGSGQTVRLGLRPDGDDLVAELGGSIAAGLPRVRFVRRVDDPRRFVGHAFAHVLRSLGVEVTGSVKLGGTTEQQRLVFVQSQPLSVLLSELGKSSDNFVAEMVLKTLGAERTGSAGTSLAGAESIEELLRELGLHRDGTRIENGSGLFDANRVSAAQVAGVLRAMASDPRTSSEFIAHLAIGGVDGTLRSRFKAHAASRRVRAKTGTLRATIALSGYVLPRVGSGPAVFSVLVDGLPGQHAEAKQKIDAIVERTLLLLDAQS